AVRGPGVAIRFIRRCSQISDLLLQPIGIRSAAGSVVRVYQSVTGGGKVGRHAMFRIVNEGVCLIEGIDDPDWPMRGVIFVSRFNNTGSIGYTQQVNPIA